MDVNRKEYCRKYYLKNRDSLLEYEREYRFKNKEARKQYRQKNKKAIDTYHKKYRQKNRGAIRAYHRRYSYGLTEAQYNALLQKYDNKCVICKTSFSTVRKSLTAHIDHDHRTGNVRGLLCIKCNTAISYLNDSPVLLYRAINYLYNNESNCSAALKTGDNNL